MRPAPAAAAAAQPAGAAGQRGGLLNRWQNRGKNRVLALLGGVGLAAVWAGAFVSVAPNRLVTGRGVALGALLAGPWWALLAPAALLAGAVFWPPRRRSRAGRRERGRIYRRLCGTHGGSHSRAVQAVTFTKYR